MKRLNVLLTMCLVGTMIGMLQAPPASSALPGQPHIVARSGNHSWTFIAPAWGTCALSQEPGATCVYTHMGPAGAPAGTGSLSFDSDDPAATTAFEGVASLARFGGTRLDDITDLSYHSQNRNLATHSPAYPPPVNATILEPRDHAELHLDVDSDGDGDYDLTLVFDPDKNLSQNPSMDQTVATGPEGDVNKGWFRWDPLKPDALWHEESTPGTTFFWGTYLNDNRKAKLAPGAPTGFHAGGEGRFVHAHVDNFRFGTFQDTRRYDFEAEATPGADRCHVTDPTCDYTQTYGSPTLVSQTATAANPLADDDSRFVNMVNTDNHATFSSHAENLATDDSPWEDVFLCDLTTMKITTVSTCPGGVCPGGGSVPNDHSYMSDTSDDGRYVVFRSDASNLVAGDTNGVGDIFRKDMTTGALERVNTSSSGAEADRWGNHPTISGDGRYVTFSSRATNLVPGDTNDDWDIFVKDMTTNAIERILRNDGSQTAFNEKKAEISGDGTYVAFVSGDSSIVPGDTNDRVDVFRWNRITKLSDQVTEGNRRSTNPSISYFGDLIAFQTNADDFGGDTNGEQPDIYLADGDGSNKRIVSVKSDDVTQSNQGAYDPSLGYFSGTLAYVAFESEATNLGYGNDTNQDRDVFVRIVDLSVPADSRTVPYTSGNAPSFRPHLNVFGRLGYESHATNLLELDKNHRKDIFQVDVSSPGGEPTFYP